MKGVTRFTTFPPAAPLLAVLMLSFQADAQTYTWTGGGVSNLWSEAANWSPEAVPSSGARIDIGSNALVLLDVNATISHLSLGGTLEIVGYTLDVNSTTGDGIQNFGNVLIGAPGGSNSTLQLRGDVTLSGTGEYLFDGSTLSGARVQNLGTIQVPEAASLVFRGADATSSRFQVLDFSGTNAGILRFGAANLAQIQIGGMLNDGEMYFQGDGFREITGPGGTSPGNSNLGRIDITGGVNRMTATWKNQHIEVSSVAVLECQLCVLDTNTALVGRIEVYSTLEINETPVQVTPGGWSLGFGRSNLNSTLTGFFNEASVGNLSGLEVRRHPDVSDQAHNVGGLRLAGALGVDIRPDARLQLLGTRLHGHTLSVTGPGTIRLAGTDFAGGTLAVSQTQVEHSATWHSDVIAPGQVALSGGAVITQASSFRNIQFSASGLAINAPGYSPKFEDCFLPEGMEIRVNAVWFAGTTVLDGTIKLVRGWFSSGARLNGYGRIILDGAQAQLRTELGAEFWGGFGEDADMVVAFVSGDAPTIETLINEGKLFVSGEDIEVRQFNNHGHLKLAAALTRLRSIDNTGGRVDRRSGTVFLRDLILGGTLAESPTQGGGSQRQGGYGEGYWTDPVAAATILEGVTLEADLNVTPNTTSSQERFRLRDFVRNDGTIRFDRSDINRMQYNANGKAFELLGNGTIDFGRAQGPDSMEYLWVSMQIGGNATGWINHGNTFLGNASLDGPENHGQIIVDDATGMRFGNGSNHGSIELKSNGRLRNGLIDNYGLISGTSGSLLETAVYQNQGRLDMAGGMPNVTAIVGGGTFLYRHADWLWRIIVNSVFPVGGAGIGETRSGFLETGPGAVLVFQLGGPKQSDHLQLSTANPTHTTHLDGYIAVQTVGDFRPEPGMQFRLITAGGAWGGEFSGVLNQTPFPDLEFELDYSEGFHLVGWVNLIVGGSNQNEVQPDPALTALTACPPRAGLGHQVTVSAHLENLGPDPAAGVGAQIFLPAGLEFAPGFSAPPGCQAAAAGLFCEGLALGPPLPLELPLVVTSNMGSRLNVAAFLDAPIDVNTANNARSASIEIIPDLLFADGMANCLEAP